ncbi:hypothetical protein [Methylobacterium sp. WL120]|uniref:hypothetical protein n=1 Tax=Methylobacterium sp. WL120 TaxID=2603887 RepID=UPI0011D64512|nr:hypothetical protein [Methylobacterium sp. WL120]TXM61569.1 hypothetical protein FV229_23180 [Methylobacterium sp. WL120]
MDERGNNMKLCRVPLCPRCFMNSRGKQTGIAIKRTFAGAANENMAFLTLLVPPTTDLSVVDPCMGKTENRLRNLIRNRRKTDPRWDTVQYTGWWEMERHDWQDFHGFGRNKKLAMEGLGWPQFANHNDDTVWQPHLHAIVCLGSVSRDEFAEALRAKGHGSPYQVDLQGFDQRKDVDKNISDLVRYSMKFRIEADYKMSSAKLSWDGTALSLQRDWWRDKDIRDYVEWLMSKRGGFERLRTSVGVKQVGVL